jgi:hypothetical protein
MCEDTTEGTHEEYQSGCFASDNIRTRNISSTGQARSCWFVHDKLSQQVCRQAAGVIQGYSYLSLTLVPEDCGAPRCLASEERPDEPEVQWRLVQTYPCINSPYLFVYYVMTTHFLSNEIEL